MSLTALQPAASLHLHEVLVMHVLEQHHDLVNRLPALKASPFLTDIKRVVLCCRWRSGLPRRAQQAGPAGCAWCAPRPSTAR